MLHSDLWHKFLQVHSCNSIFSSLPPAAPSWKRIYLIYLAEKVLRVCVANCLEIFFWEVLQSSLTQWVTDSPSFLQLLVGLFRRIFLNIFSKHKQMFCAFSSPPPKRRNSYPLGVHYTFDKNQVTQWTKIIAIGATFYISEQLTLLILQRPFDFTKTEDFLNNTQRPWIIHIIFSKDDKLSTITLWLLHCIYFTFHKEIFSLVVSRSVCTLLSAHRNSVTN